MENTELEKILYRVDRTRDQNSFCNENNYYAAHECQFLLTYYLNKFIGTQKQFLSTHKIDHKLRYKKENFDLGDLKDFLFWISAAKKPNIKRTDVENFKNINFDIFDSALADKTATKISQISDDEWKNELIANFEENEYLEKLNSSLFWNTYLHMSETLNKATEASIRGHKKNALEIKSLKILEILKVLRRDHEGERDAEGIIDRLQIIIKDIDNEEIINVFDDKRKNNFKEFIDYSFGIKNKSASESLAIKPIEFIWDFQATLKRGIYHTPHCWAERNILSRCLLLINGINPYADSESPNNLDEKTPYQKGIFELKALMGYLETKIARWGANNFYTEGLERSLECLTKVNEVFGVLLRLHMAKEKIDEPQKDIFLRRDLISLNEISILTGLKKSTIQNESKALEKKNKKLLVPISKNNIEPKHRASFTSRCFDLRSVLRWLEEKQYHIKDSPKSSRIPLDVKTDKKRKNDMGLMDILNI